MNLKALAFLLLLSVPAFAAMDCIGDASQVIWGPEYGMKGLILAVIGLTIVVIALAYMLGTTFGNTNYVVFAKDEAYHLMFSMLILMGFSGIMLASCNTVDMFYSSVFDNLGTLPSGCFSSTSTMQEVATCYMGNAKAEAVRLSQHYIDQYIGKLMDSTFAWSLQIPMMNSYTSTADAYKRVLSSEFDIILNSFLIPALMSISMQKIGLDFITENLVYWMLPSAFVLRIFIPTRQMGNMIIALVIGFYVLVPFMYVFNFAMYDALLTSGDCTAVRDYVCDFALDGTSCANACSNPNGFWQVGRLIPLAFFLPNLTISIVITFLSSLNKALKVLG